MYELTDRLAFYLCSRKPDHQTGQHYIVPEMSDSLDQTEFAKVAKKKLQLVSNHHVYHNFIYNYSVLLFENVDPKLLITYHSIME
jgi:hypothetical protein